MYSKTEIPFGWFPLSYGASILSGRNSARSVTVLAHLGSLPAGSDVGLVSAVHSESSWERACAALNSFKDITGNLERRPAYRRALPIRVVRRREQMEKHGAVHHAREAVSGIEQLPAC